ncbi:MAG: GH31, partial [uncultured Blastococcus sp.]
AALAVPAPLRLPARQRPHGAPHRRVRVVRPAPHRAGLRLRRELRAAGEERQLPAAVGAGGVQQRLARVVQAGAVLVLHARHRRLRQHLERRRRARRRPGALRPVGHRRGHRRPRPVRHRRAAARAGAAGLPRPHGRPGRPCAVVVRPLDVAHHLPLAGRGRGDRGAAARAPDPVRRPPRRHRLVPRGVRLRPRVRPRALPGRAGDDRPPAGAGSAGVAVAVAERQRPLVDVRGGSRRRAPGEAIERPRLPAARRLRRGRRRRRRLEPGRGRLAAGEVRAAVRPGHRRDQGRLRRGRPARRGVRRRPRHGHAQPLPPAVRQGGLGRDRDGARRGRRRPVGAGRLGRLSALPGPLVRRRGRPLAGPAVRAASDAVVRAVRVPLLQLRRRRLLRLAQPRAVPALGPARAVQLTRAGARRRAARALGPRPAGR